MEYRSHCDLNECYNRDNMDYHKYEHIYLVDCIVSCPNRDTTANWKSSILDTLAIDSSASGRLLVYALEPIGLDKGYVVIQCITNHISLCDRGFPLC